MAGNNRYSRRVMGVRMKIGAHAKCEQCGREIGREARDVIVNFAQKRKVIPFCDPACKTGWLGVMQDRPPTTETDNAGRRT